MSEGSEARWVGPQEPHTKFKRGGACPDSATRLHPCMAGRARWRFSRLRFAITGELTGGLRHLLTQAERALPENG